MPNKKLIPVLSILVLILGGFVAWCYWPKNHASEIPVIVRPPGEVGVGETRTINGVEVTFNSLVQDSRCPVDVQCIQAGAITANLTLTADGKTLTRNFASDEAPQEFGNYLISISHIAPPRHSGTEPDPHSYVLGFTIVKK